MSDVNGCLKIFVVDEESLSSMKNVSLYPSDVFKVFYKPEWLNDEFAVTALREIDKKQIDLNSDVAEQLRKKYYIRPDQLSTGFKNLMVCKNMDLINRFRFMGRNCYKFLAEIAKVKCVQMALEYYIDFPREAFKNTVFEIYAGDKICKGGFDTADYFLYDLADRGVLDV